MVLEAESGGVRKINVSVGKKEMVKEHDEQPSIYIRFFIPSLTENVLVFQSAKNHKDEKPNLSYALPEPYKKINQSIHFL